MPIEVFTALIGVGGTVLGVWIGSRIQKNAADRVLSRQAFSKLVEAFSKELAILKTSTEDEMGSTAKLLQENHKKHLIAYLELRATLDAKHREELDRRWQTYTQENRDLYPEEREMYRFVHLYRDEGLTEEDMRLLAIKHIQNLVDFENTI